jgi:hypothetical protein
MRIARVLLLLAVVLAGCASVPPAPVAQPGTDEFQIEATVLAMYNVVSGPAGRHDWDRFKELFAPGALLIETRIQNGAPVRTARTPDEFATEMQKELAEQALFEHPVATRVEHFRNVAHVFSTFESRRAAADAQPFRRGVNSIQLVRDGERWVIQSVLSQGEAAEPLLPR